MKLYVQSFGCQMSVADGEEMARPFAARGFTPAEELDQADAALINTCTVRQHAEDKALSLLGRLRPWKERRPERFLIVAGCAAERLKDQIRRRFPHVDLVVGAKSIEQYPEILEQALRERFDWASENSGAWNSAESFAAPAADAAGASAYVTIMRGCNYACSYCIVPAVRGRELYRPMDTVLAESCRRLGAGAREIMLLGQTVNSYRPAGGGDFADLLRALEPLPGLERLRFMSPHPHYVNERMIGAMAESSKVCRHLHLPLQSGSDRVLKRMRRNYTAAEFLDKVDRLRGSMPDLVLTTDVIVGFPGETEEDFDRTLEILRRMDPASAYCFKFSPRPGTEAAGFSDDVSPEIKEDRLRRVLEPVEESTRRHLADWRGRQVRVLLEDERFGRTEHFFKAVLEAPAKPRTIVSGTVVGATPTCLEIRASS